MTIASEINRSGPYNGNGVTTVFDYDFRIVDENHVKVIKADAAGIETILTIDADYIVSDVGNPAGGQVALTVPLPVGKTLTLLRAVPFTQETDLENQGAYYAETVENSLDLAAMRDQELAEGLARAVKLKPSSAISDLVFPEPDASKVVGWNAAGTELENKQVAGIGLVVVDDDATLAGDSHTNVPTQHAVKGYAIPLAISTAFTLGLLGSINSNALLAAISPVRVEAGAAANTLLDLTRRKISVADFGAVGNGTDETAKIQAAENARSALGGILQFEEGKTYGFSAPVNVSRAAGGSWRGNGAQLKALANATVFANLTNAVVGATTRRFRMTGFHIDGNGFTGVRMLHEQTPFNTKIDDCTIRQVQFCASFIGPNAATQTGWIQISDIQQYGAGSWAFYGFDDTKYLFHIEMNNIHQVGTGVATWESDFWIEGRRAVGLSINNCWSGSLDGAATGLRLRGDCQGVFVTNATFVWPKTGIEALTWTDTLKPSYVYMSNIGVDQHTQSGAWIEGRTWYLTNCNFANGYLHGGNSGQACIIKAVSTDISILNALFAYDQRSGLVVENGAKKIRVGNFTAENNNQVAGAFYEVDLGASPFVDVKLHSVNVIGAAGVNATGQRVVNGITSPTVFKSNSAASTTAVITQEDLKTYTIPANVLKPGQKIKLRAFGVTAANANTKTIRLWFGGNSIADHNGAWNNVPWLITAEIEITAANAQAYSSIASPSAVSPAVRQNSLTVVDTAAIIVKATGQNGTASAGDITCNGFEVQIVD